NGNGISINRSGEAYIDGSIGGDQGTSNTLFAKVRSDGNLAYAVPLNLQYIGDSQAHAYRVTANGTGYALGEAGWPDPHPWIPRLNADQPGDPPRLDWGFYYPSSIGPGTSLDTDTGGVLMAATVQQDMSSNVLLVKDALLDGSNLYTGIYRRADGRG